MGRHLLEALLVVGLLGCGEGTIGGGDPRSGYPSEADSNGFIPNGEYDGSVPWVGDDPAAPSASSTNPSNPASPSTNPSGPSGSTTNPGAGGSEPPFPGDLPSVGQKFLTSRTTCMAPCAVYFNAQAAESLAWDEVRDARFVWDFDDGGASSEGFLGAHVFDQPGTYDVGLAVDDEQWTRTTITVSPPQRTICVSPSSSFGDCPSSSSNDHFTSLSAASGQNHRNAHVLLHRGESFGSVDNFKDQGPTLYGAYGSGAKPKVTQANEVRMGDQIIWQDLDVSASRVLNLANWSMLRRVDAHGTIGGNPQYWIIAYYVDDFFVIDCNATIGDTTSNGAGVYVYQAQRSAFKGNSLYYQQGGTGHAFRSNGADGFLIQDNVIDDNGSQDILTIRGDNESGSPNTSGNAYWTLIQGNEFRGNLVEYKTQYPEANELVQYLIHEDNAHVDGSSLILATVHDAVVRGNAFIGMRGQGVSVADKSNYYDPENIEIYDNTN